MGSFEERLEFLPRVTMDAETELVIDIEINGVLVGQRILQVTKIDWFVEDNHSEIDFIISDYSSPNDYLKFKQIKQ